MAPRVEAFLPWELERRAQYKPDGRARKPPVELERCALMEMMQYHCELKGERNDNTSKVFCEEVVRFFRRCANGLTVETTSWEGIYSK